MAPKSMQSMQMSLRGEWKWWCNCKGKSFESWNFLVGGGLGLLANNHRTYFDTAPPVSFSFRRLAQAYFWRKPMSMSSYVTISGFLDTLYFTPLAILYRLKVPLLLYPVSIQPELSALTLLYILSEGTYRACLFGLARGWRHVQK